MRLRHALFAATVLAGPLLAPGHLLAQPISGAYVSLGAGGNYLQQERVQSSPGLLLTGKRLATDFGEVGIASLGYGFGNGLRVELEGDIRHNGVRQISGFVNGAGPTSSGGDQYTYGGMVNALFDMDIGYNWIYPYFGLGAGAMVTTLDGVHSNGTNNGFRFATSGSSTNFAYQGIFGLSFPIAPVPGLSMTAEYRFLGVLNSPSFKAVDNLTSVPGGYRSGNFNVNSDYNHSFLVGVRYAFDTAPPPAPAAAPAPVPAVVPARTYLVFFDWDRADLTDRARQIVAEAAQASTRVQTTRIEVQGNADRSGTPAYNQRLSLRRAQTVAAELVRDGVPQSAISIEAFGDTRPLVPTAPGVREPQNRRVAIILR